jgi:hypothetical protein
MDGEIVLVAPATPDRLIGIRGYLRLRHAALGKYSAISIKRRKIIAAMNGYERLEGPKLLARGKRHRLIKLDRDPRTGRGDRERQCYELRHRFHMAGGKPVIAPPDIDDRGAAAVIGGVHAHEVALNEASMQRLHPIAAVHIGCARKGPVIERAVGCRFKDMRAVHPAIELDRLPAPIAVGHTHDGKTGKAIIKGDADLFFNLPTRSPSQEMKRAFAMDVLHALAARIHERKIIDMLAVHPNRLAGLEIGKRHAPLLHDDATAQ